MIEEWRPVAGYETHYAVSNLGRVKSLDRYVKHGGAHMQLRRGALLKAHVNETGYRRVRLRRENIGRNFLVHQLVAKAFLGKSPTTGAPVNHIDFDRSNNRIDNLEWTTPRANMAHSRDAARFCPVANPNCRGKLTPEQVVSIRERVANGEARKSVAAAFSIDPSSVSRLVKRKRWVNLTNTIDVSVNSSL